MLGGHTFPPPTLTENTASKSEFAKLVGTTHPVEGMLLYLLQSAEAPATSFLKSGGGGVEEGGGGARSTQTQGLEGRPEALSGPGVGVGRWRED